MHKQLYADIEKIHFTHFWSYDIEKSMSYLVLTKLWSQLVLSFPSFAIK